INKLSGIKQLVVRPTSSVRKYTALDQDPVTAGRELGVDYVLESNLQMIGEKTRATVYLWTVNERTKVWNAKSEEQCSKVYELEDAITGRIVAGLAIELTGEDKKRLARRYTESTDAYRAYLRGRYFLEKRTPEARAKTHRYL